MVFLLHLILFRVHEVKSFSFLSFVNYLLSQEVLYVIVTVLCTLINILNS